MPWPLWPQRPCKDVDEKTTSKPIFCSVEYQLSEKSIIKFVVNCKGNIGLQHLYNWMKIKSLWLTQDFSDKIWTLELSVSSLESYGSPKPHFVPLSTYLFGSTLLRKVIKMVICAFFRCFMPNEFGHKPAFQNILL